MKIKYLVAIAILLVLGCISASAQCSKSDTTVQFNPHWYIHLESGANYSTGQQTFLGVLSPSVEIGAGYNFTPLWGIRGMLGWHQSRGYLPKSTYPDLLNSKSYAYQQIQLFADATLNLSNLIGGYRHDRVCDVYPYIGIGMLIGVETQHTEDGSIERHLDCPWNPGQPFFGARAGAFARLAVSEHVNITADFYGQSTSDRLNSRTENSLDSQLNLMLGVTYRFKSKTQPYIYTSAAAAQEAAVAALAAAQLKQEKVLEVAEAKSEAESAIVFADSAKVEVDSALLMVDSTLSALAMFTAADIAAQDFAEDNAELQAAAEDVKLAADNANKVIEELPAKNAAMALTAVALEEAIRAAEKASKEAAELAAKEDVSEEVVKAAAARATAAAAASAAAAEAYAKAVAEAKYYSELARKATDAVLIAASKARMAAYKKAVFSKDVFFTLDSYELNNKALNDAMDIAVWYAAHPDKKIMLVGHASKEGSHGHNMTLSKDRARAVKKFITAAGVPASAIKLDYKGDTQDVYPIFEMNRCVTCRISKK